MQQAEQLDFLPVEISGYGLRKEVREAIEAFLAYCRDCNHRPRQLYVTASQRRSIERSIRGERRRSRKPEAWAGTKKDWIASSPRVGEGAVYQGVPLVCKQPREHPAPSQAEMTT